MVADAAVLLMGRKLTENLTTILRNVCAMVESKKRKLLYAACHWGM